MFLCLVLLGWIEYEYLNKSLKHELKDFTQRLVFSTVQRKENNLFTSFLVFISSLNYFLYNPLFPIFLVELCFDPVERFRLSSNFPWDFDKSILNVTYKFHFRSTHISVISNEPIDFHDICEKYVYHPTVFSPSGILFVLFSKKVSIIWPCKTLSIPVNNALTYILFKLFRVLSIFSCHEVDTAVELKVSKNNLI